MGLKDLFSFFGKGSSPKNDYYPVHTDMHSHLIPGIDDGVKDIQEALEVVRSLYYLGFKSIITTPHVMQEGYNNDKTIILSGLENLKQALSNSGLPVELDAAAEYYFDDNFFSLIKKNELLTIGKNGVFFELPFINQPPQLFDIVFELQNAGYQPILAHPERYSYFHHDQLETLFKLHEHGVWLQVNLFSLLGFYSPAVKKIAREMVENQLVDLIGTDVHNIRHVNLLKHCLQDKYICQFIETYPLKNNQLPKN